MWSGPVLRKRGITHGCGFEWWWCSELMNHNGEVIAFLWGEPL